MSRFFRIFTTSLAVALGVVGVGVALYAWRLPPFSTALQVTDNAYVRGQVTLVAPQLAGYVAEVAVQDYQQVEAGQLLVRLDDRIFRQKVEQAQAALAGQKAALANSEQQRLSGEARIRSGAAQVKGAEAAVKNAQASWKRAQSLQQRGVATQSIADEASAALQQAEASLTQAQANLEVAHQDLQATIVSRAGLEAAVAGAEASVHLAQIDLENTRVAAPQAGRLGEVGARLGQYVAAGTQLMAVVPNRIWVTANFKETQLDGMEVGQPVSFTADAVKGVIFTGRIERFSPAAGSEFSVLKPDNATGNFTKVAQRVPVRISIDAGQEMADRLVPGMSVVAEIDTNEHMQTPVVMR